MTSRPPQPSKWAQTYFSYCRDQILVVWAQKRCSRCIFRKVENATYMLHYRWWRHDPHKPQNGPKPIFSYCRDQILVVWAQKQCSRCIFKKFGNTTYTLHHKEIIGMSVFTQFSRYRHVVFFLASKFYRESLNFFFSFIFSKMCLRNSENGVFWKKCVFQKIIFDFRKFFKNRKNIFGWIFRF